MKFNRLCDIRPASRTQPGQSILATSSLNIVLTRRLIDIIRSLAHASTSSDEIRDELQK